MQVTLTPELESFFARLAADEGRSTDELVREALTRFAEEKEAALLPDDERAAIRTEFRASLDEADAEIDRGEGTVIASESDRRKLVGDIMDQCRVTVAVIGIASAH